MVDSRYNLIIDNYKYLEISIEPIIKIQKCQHSFLIMLKLKRCVQSSRS